MILKTIFIIIGMCIAWVVIAIAFILVKERNGFRKQSKLLITNAVKCVLTKGGEEYLAARLKITPEKLQERIRKHNWTSREVNILPAVLNFISTQNKSRDE